MKKTTLIITFILLCSSFIFAQKQNHKVEANESDTITTVIDSGVNVLSIYPNPFNNLLTIDCSENISDIRIYDINGRLIFEQKNMIGKNTISLAEQKSGICFVKTENKTIKIVKQ